MFRIDVEFISRKTAKMNDFDGILTFVPDLWRNIWQPRHHILNGLSRYFKVLWISPPFYVETWRKKGRRKTWVDRGLRKVSDCLWTYAPYLPADYKYKYVKHGVIPGIFRRYNSWWTRQHITQLKHLLWRMGIQRVILYIWRPEFAKFVERIPHNLLCYHIDDEYTFDPAFDHPISEIERDLIIKSDLVFIHSKTLLNKKGHLNPSTHYVPNGVDFEYYRKVIETEKKEIGDFEKIPKPWIGYVGNIKRHIDLKLLLDLSRRRKKWSIILIGPVKQDHLDIQEEVELLQKENNVYFFGSKKPQDLPQYINQLDVCLMCYKKTEYTKYIYPIKLHEYLACGKPVISTRLPNLEEFEEVLYFANGVDDWIKKIEKALDESDQIIKQKRIAVAQENSWDRRVEFIKSLFDSKLNIASEQDFCKN